MRLLETCQSGEVRVQLAVGKVPERGRTGLLPLFHRFPGEGCLCSFISFFFYTPL